MNIFAYFAKNSFVRLASCTIGVAAAFFVTPHMLRCMGSGVYGVWALISSLSAYYMLLGLGVTQSVSNKIAQADARRDAERARSLFAAALVIGMIAFTLVLLIAIAVCFMTETMSGNLVETGVFVASFLSFSAAVAVQLLLRAAHGVLAGKMRWTTLAVLGMTRTLANGAAILIFVSETASPATNLLTVALIAAGTLIFEALAHLFLACRSIPLRITRSAFSRAVVKELMLFGVSILVLQFGDLLRSRTQIYLIGLLLSIQHVTIFSLASQFINYMNDIILSAFGIMNPYFSGLHALGKTDECRRSLLISLTLSYSVASVASLGLVFYGGLFVERWIGPGFAQVQSILTPMAIGCLFSIGDTPSSGFLLGLGKQVLLARRSLLEGLFNTLVSIPALLFIGLPGVGWTLFTCAVLSRLFLLPRQICAVSGISPAAYYKNMAFALGPSIIAQCAYYALIAPLLKADYLILLAAGAGQFVVAGLVLLGIALLQNRFSRMPQEGAQEG